MRKAIAMTYVDGFVIPVPKGKLAAYRRMARQGLRMWKKHGALDYKECVADDMQSAAPDGTKARSGFLKGLKPKETVVFAYIVFRSKAHRDRVSKKVMAEPGMQDMDPAAMPFDWRRMSYGGFRTIVE
jgi:uncharacterized protein YbaA (DUF1428 family)